MVRLTPHLLFSLGLWASTANYVGQGIVFRQASEGWPVYLAILISFSIVFTIKHMKFVPKSGWDILDFVGFFGSVGVIGFILTLLN